MDCKPQRSEVRKDIWEPLDQSHTENKVNFSQGGCALTCLIRILISSRLEVSQLLGSLCSLHTMSSSRFLSVLPLDTSSLPVFLWYGGFQTCPKEKSHSCQHGLRQTQGNKSGNHLTRSIATYLLHFSLYGSCKALYNTVPHSRSGFSHTQYLLCPLKYVE